MVIQVMEGRGPMNMVEELVDEEEVDSTQVEEALSSTQTMLLRHKLAQLISLVVNSIN